MLARNEGFQAGRPTVSSGASQEMERLAGLSALIKVV
jgi:hypothetical protein